MSWRSKESVTLSSSEVEWIALSKAAEEVLLLSQLITTVSSMWISDTSLFMNVLKMEESGIFS
ncbi:hypothetical protein ACHAXS_005139 [Conticribra weissflogii]